MLNPDAGVTDFAERPDPESDAEVLAWLRSRLNYAGTRNNDPRESDADDRKSRFHRRGVGCDRRGADKRGNDRFDCRARRDLPRELCDGEGLRRSPQGAWRIGPP